jgi:hypothetical protein
MITLYLWGADFLYKGTVEVDEFGPLPLGSTSTSPPETTGTEVAIWYGEWVVLPEAPAPAQPVPPTTEDITAQYEQAVQAKLDGAAQEARYDSISTAVSYAEEPAVPKFQEDGKAFREWRSLVWAYAYDQLAKVLSGQRTQPTVEEFLAELPALVLPS